MTTLRETLKRPDFPIEHSIGLLWRAMARQLTFDGLVHTPPMWRERRMFDELASFQAHPISRGEGLAPGRGLPVFLIPGYMTGDPSLAPLARALGGAGYRVETSGIWLNVGCAGELFRPIEARLERHVAASGGRKVFLIGQSRGGGFARGLASRRPDLVRGIVTLGTPLLDPLALHVFVLANLGVVSALGSLGVPGVHSTNCLRSDRCCAPVWRDLARPLDATTAFLSIYSRSDGIVDWRACLDPAARHVEVDSSHSGMAFNLETVRAIAAELEQASAGP